MSISQHEEKSWNGFFCCCIGKLDINKTKDLYRDLVSVFDKLILPTHASCHVQYFMFYVCSFKLVSRNCFKNCLIISASLFCLFYKNQLFSVVILPLPYILAEDTSGFISIFTFPSLLCYLPFQAFRCISGLAMLFVNSK